MGFLVKVIKDKNYITYEWRIGNWIIFGTIWGLIIMVVLYWLSYTGNLKAKPYGNLFYLVSPTLFISMFLLDKELGAMFKASYGNKKVEHIPIMQTFIFAPKIKVKK